jgi:GNAT superfamily N-acetyltransferase
MTSADLDFLLVQELSATDWQRYRDIRLESLKSDPDAFGGDLHKASQESQSDWQKRFEKVTPIVAALGNRDCAILTIENLIGDFGATCWIGGCWVDPNVRGKGIMRALFNYLDENADKRGWQIQGLGVWQYNQSAIDVYLALGFENRGEPVPSTSKPGLFYQRMIREAGKK